MLGEPADCGSLFFLSIIIQPKQQIVNEGELF